MARTHRERAEGIVRYFLRTLYAQTGRQLSLTEEQAIPVLVDCLIRAAAEHARLPSQDMLQTLLAAQAPAPPPAPSSTAAPPTRRCSAEEETAREQEEARLFWTYQAERLRQEAAEPTRLDKKAGNRYT